MRGFRDGFGDAADDAAADRNMTMWIIGWILVPYDERMDGFVRSQSMSSDIVAYARQKKLDKQIVCVCHEQSNICQ